MRVLIVDDEPRAREGLVALVRQVPGVVLAGEAGSGHAAVESIGKQRPDLVLLDIQMPDLDGFEVLERCRPVGFYSDVIFITAHSSHLLRAFEVHALDYLLKPFSDGRFFEALARAQERFRQRRDHEAANRLLTTLAAAGLIREPTPAASPTGRLRIPVKTRGLTRFLDIGTLDWIEADAYCVKLHVGAQEHVLRGPLGRFETELPSAQFFRISRSAIVNLDRIQGIRDLPGEDTVVVLDGGTELSVSPTRRRTLVDRLERGR